MTKTDHLTKAKDYIAKGEDYYRKAAEEIVAEREEYDTPYSVVADCVGKSKKWCMQLVQWHTSGDRDATPFGGAVAEERRERSVAKRVARERPETLAEAIAEAPAEAQRKIADKLIQSASTEPSLKQVAEGPKRQAREPKSAERKLGEAVFALWEVGELLMDDVPPDDARVRMSGLAEKAMALSTGIAHLLDTGQFEDAFRELVEEVGAQS